MLRSGIVSGIESGELGGTAPPSPSPRPEGGTGVHRCHLEKIFATPLPVGLNCPEHMPLSFLIDCLSRSHVGKKEKLNILPL